MKVVNITEAITVMFQDSFFGIVDAIVDAWNRLFRRQTNLSLLACNVVWFTNCTWVEQLYAFQQIDKYLYQGKVCSEKLQRKS